MAQYELLIRVTGQCRETLANGAHEALAEFARKDLKFLPRATEQKTPYSWTWDCRTAGSCSKAGSATAEQAEGKGAGEQPSAESRA